MKLFVAKGYHLSSLQTPTKLVYSFFLLFIAIGLWTSWDIYVERIGGDLEATSGQPSVAERYLEPSVGPSLEVRPGAADVSGPRDGAEGGGLQLDLPPEPELPSASSGQLALDSIKAPWIMDVFHQHLFSVSVVFLILAHLFVLTRLAPVISNTVVTTAGISGLLHVLTPAIIHSSGGFLWLMPVTGAAMGISWSVLVVWPFGAMWLGWGASKKSAPTG